MSFKEQQLIVTKQKYPLTVKIFFIGHFYTFLYAAYTVATENISLPDGSMKALLNTNSLNDSANKSMLVVCSGIL